MTVLASALIDRGSDLWSDDPTGDTARAEKAIDSALTLQPDSSTAHDAKGGFRRETAMGTGDRGI